MALPKAVTFSPLLFTKTLVEAELDSKHHDWVKRRAKFKPRECVELGPSRAPLHYQRQHKAGTDAMQAANNDAWEVASQRAMRRHVKYHRDWGTDGTTADTVKQAPVLRARGDICR